AALRASGPIEVDDTRIVDTSFPGFVALARDAGLDIEERGAWTGARAAAGASGSAARDAAAAISGRRRLRAMSVPTITIDGPTASGKGTVAERVARALGWSYLDSGALYRLCALQAQREGVDLDDEARLASIARALPVRFADGRIELAGADVTDLVRDEAVGNAASRVAALPAVREALLALQRGYRRPPGLVADGRDMGTVVFPDAD